MNFTDIELQTLNNFFNGISIPTEIQVINDKLVTYFEPVLAPVDVPTQSLPDASLASEVTNQPV